MEAWLTRQWQRTTAWQFFLRPVSWLFRLLVALRCGAYGVGLLQSTSVRVPVIIVGNISVGGTGKTPLVLALVDALTKRGKHCGIVTRGYHRHPNGEMAQVIHVVPGNLRGGVVSDEATLLARRSGVPVYAGTDRVVAAQTLLRNHADVDVIVSDDGMQHYALRRDMEICVIDAERGLGNGALLPAGPLREPASRLNAVDAIVINYGSNSSATDQLYGRTPTFKMALTHERFVNLKTSECADLNAALARFQGKRIHAVAGIGHPQRFFSHLAGLGLPPTTSLPLPDHHHFHAGDFEGVNAEIVLMTEKDAVKCSAYADECMWFMRVDAVLPDEFTDFVLQKLFTGRLNHVT
jgi:tetraacyldisaccharide 4'-kinase